MMTPIENRFQELNAKLQELLAYELQLSRQQHASAGVFDFVIRGLIITLAIILTLSLLLNISWQI